MPFGEGGGGLFVPLRRGDALPTPAAPQPHTLPYNALFMRSGRLSSEMPLQSHAVPVPAVTLAMRVLSQHGTASLPAPARAMPENTPGPRELSLGANTASAKAQLARPSRHPQGCGCWSLFPGTECPFLLQVTRQRCSHKSWPPALKGQHKCCLVRFS